MKWTTMKRTIIGIVAVFGLSVAVGLQAQQPPKKMPGPNGTVQGL